MIVIVPLYLDNFVVYPIKMWHFSIPFFIFGSHGLLMFLFALMTFPLRISFETSDIPKAFAVVMLLTHVPPLFRSETFLPSLLKYAIRLRFVKFGRELRPVLP